MAKLSGNQAILLVLVAVLLGAGAFFLLRGDAPLVPEGSGAAMQAAATPESMAQNTLATNSGPDAGRLPTERVQAAAVPDAHSTDLPPDLAAALCGFKGRLLQPGGEPAAEAKVLIYRFDPDAILGEGLAPLATVTMEPRVEGGEGRTGEDGRFLISGVWPRAIYVLHAGAGGEAPLWQLIERTPSPGEVVDLGDIRLKACGTIVGRVLDEAGKPVAGALIRAADVPGQFLAFVPLERFHPEGALVIRESSARGIVRMPAWVKQRFADLPIPSARSASDGAFRLQGVAPGNNVVVVTASEHLPYVDQRVKVDAGETKDVGTVELGEGEIVEGRVVDAKGHPVANAEVLVAPTTTMVPVDFAGPPFSAGADGRFSLAGLPSGQVTGAARRDVREPWTIVEPQVIDKDLVITLPARHALTVRLVSKPGQEIEGSRLRLLQPPPGGSREAVDMAMMGFATEVRLDDRLQTLEDGRLRLADLPQGTYVLLGSAAGHAVAVETVELQSDREVTLTLDPQDSFRVRVVDGAGKGVRNAAIYARPRGGGQRLHNMPLHCGRTAADGTLRVTQVGGSEVEVTASHPAYGAVEARSKLPVDEVRLVLDAPGLLDGRLTEGGRPPELGKWMLVITARGADMQMPIFATPDAEGRFTVKGLQPDRYRIMALESMRALNTPGGLVGFMRTAFMRGDMVNEPFEIRAGQRTEVTLDTQKKEAVTGPAANVSGTVFVNGRPGKGMLIGGWVQGGQDGRDWRRLSAEVDAGGRFDLGLVPAGQVHLTLNDPGTLSDNDNLFAGPSGLWSERIEVKANEARTLSIEVQTGSLAGTVLDPDGGPASACRVRVHRTGGAGGGASQSTLADERGRFSFAALPDGTYTIDARGADGGKAMLDGVRVVAASAALPVQVRLQRTFKVQGNIDLKPLGTETPQWLYLSVTPVVRATNGPSVRFGDGAQVGSDGSFTLDGLSTGDYEGQLHGSFEGQWVVDGHIEVPNADVKGVSVRIVERKPPPPSQPPKAQAKAEGGSGEQNKR